MQPMGRKPIKFPGKIDHHPKKGFVNWWESEPCHGENKKAERQQSKLEIKKIIRGT